MGLAKENLVDALIAYWSEGPRAVDEATRRTCREMVSVLARAMSGSELAALQEAPEEKRSEIESRVGIWLAMRGPRDEAPTTLSQPAASNRAEPPATDLIGSPRAPSAPSAEPPALHIRQSNAGGINVGSVGSVQGGFSLTMPAASGRTRDERPAAVSASSERERIRILFLGANPGDTPHLRLDEEVHAIDRALVTAALGSRCELVQKWAVRVGELQEHLLRTKPNLLHFSGHGSADRSIFLQGEDGLRRPVAADRLARLLGRFSARLRCVVLNACYTEEHGEAIAEQVDCVVGMSTQVSDPVAIRFASAFYQAVASGVSVKEAVEQARADIELGEMDGAEVPILVARRCDPSRVVLVAGG